MRSSTRVDEGRKGWRKYAREKNNTRTVVGKGDTSLPGDPGPELCPGREKGAKECENNTCDQQKRKNKNKKEHGLSICPFRSALHRVGSGQK